MGFYPRVQTDTTYAFLRFPISNWTEGGETFGSFSQSLTVRSTHQLSNESTDSLENSCSGGSPLQLLHLRETLWHFGFQNRRRAWVRITAILWKSSDVHSVLWNRYLVINISSSPVSLAGVGWTTTVSGRAAGGGRMIAVVAREWVEASKRTSGQSSDSLRALLKQYNIVTIKRDFPKTYWVFPIFLKGFSKEITSSTPTDHWIWDERLMAHDQII